MAAKTYSDWVIYASFFLAFVLAIVPLPDWLRWGRPAWITLVLIYWTIAIPQKVGVGFAWVVGLFMDSFTGSMLGQHALALALVAYLSLNLYQRLRMFSTWQQSLVVLALVGVNQLLSQWIESIAGYGAPSLHFLMPAIVSALLWPWIFVSLRYCRRRFSVV